MIVHLYYKLVYRLHENHTMKMHDIPMFTDTRDDVAINFQTCEMPVKFHVSIRVILIR